MKNYTEEQYHADDVGHDRPSLSNSIIKTLLNKSPRHAWLEHPRLNPAYAHKDSGRFDVGTAAHALLLEGEDKMQVVNCDDWRTKAAQQQRDEAREAGYIPILAHHYADILAMREVAVQAIADCADLSGLRLSDGTPEQTLTWTEGEVALRARLDFLSNDQKLILDYKTTEILNPDAWMRSIVGSGYDIQNAFYQRAVLATTGQEAKMIFLIQETTAPYACYFVGMSPSYLAIGAQKVEHGIALWRECLGRNEWPTYPSQIMWAEPPNWALAEAEEKQAMHKGFTVEGFLFGKVRDEK